MSRSRRPFRRFSSAVLAAVIAAPVVVAVGLGQTAHAAPVALYPDLKTLPPRELRFDRADVTPELSGVYHNVLRFSNTTYNVGEGPLILNATINQSLNPPSGPSTQRVMNSDGTFTDIPLHNDIYWHAAHHHYHFDNWGAYQLWTQSGYNAWIASGRTSGAPIYTGDKTTSCVEDEEFIASVPKVVYPSVYNGGGCLTNSQNQIHMGLSPGWGDTYDWYRQLQWIDLGQNTLGNGTYVLRSVADPDNFVYESANKADPVRESVQDNEDQTTFVVSNGTILDSDPPTGTVSINHIDTNTASSNVSVDVVARDDVSEPNQFRLSNDGTNWKTFNYTSSGSNPTTVSWNLADATTGGNSTPGLKTVYAQAHDNSGKWGPTFTDTITLGSGGGGGPPPPPPSGPYASLVAGDHPSAYWRLGETSGTTAFDSVGSSNGTYNNGVSLGSPSLLTSDANPAASFNGTNQSVGVLSNSALALASTISLEAWIKPTSLPATGAFRSIVTKPESYSLQFNGPRLEFTIIQGGTRKRLQAPSGAVAAGGTYHVVGTYDGATQRLYINGALSVSAALTGAITTNTSGLNIGSWDGSSEFFAGTLDEVAVYPTVLSASQVTNHYSAGTNNSPPPTMAQLSISRSGSGNGNVTSQPAGINCGVTCSASFTAGTSITLTAAPTNGSTFTGWTGGGCSGNSLTCTLTLNSNTTVDASFTTVPTSSLTVSKAGSGSGTVTSQPAGINCGTTCTASFNTGSNVTLTAAAAAGSAFAGWSGGGCSGTGTCVVNLTATTTVTATFNPVPTAQLTVTKAGAGSGTVTSSPAGINCGATCTANIAQGSVTLTAAPASGSNFTGWTNAGSCTTSPTCTFTLSANTTVTATFGAAPQSTYAQTVTADAPAGYWRLDETSGTTAVKAAGAANNGTYSGVTLGAPGLIGSASDKAVTFSGTNSRVQIVSNAAVSPTARVSVEAWIKPAALPATGAFASVTSKAESYSLQFNGPRLEFTIIQSGTRRRLQAPAGAIAVGNTYHVVGTYDGTTQRLYINGAQSVSAALTGAISANTNSLYIGSWDGSSEFYRGTADEVAVYSTALTAAQVSSHYSAGIAVTAALVHNAPDVRLVSVGAIGSSIGVGGATPVAPAVDDVVHRAYVTHTVGHGLTATKGVTVFDTRTWSVVARTTTGGNAPGSIAVDPLTHRVYVTAAVYAPGGVQGLVRVLDGVTGRLVRTIETGPGPKAIAVNPRTGRVYVTEQTGIDGGSAVAVIDGASGRTLATIPIGPYERYYENPLGIAVNPRTNAVYATNPLDGNVYTIDGATNAVVRSVAIGDSPTALAIGPAGAVFVAGSHRLAVIHPSGAVTHVAIGDRTRGIAVDPSQAIAYATTDGGSIVAIAHGVASAVAHADKPWGVAIGNAGTVVIADARRGSIVAFERGSEIRVD